MTITIKNMTVEMVIETIMATDTEMVTDITTETGTGGATETDIIMDMEMV